MDHLPPNRPTVVTYTYDVDSRVTIVGDPPGCHTTMTYDIAGDRFPPGVATGRRTTYTYDASDRLVAVTDPQGPTITHHDDDDEGKPEAAPAPAAPPPVAIELGSLTLRVPAAQRVWVEGRGWTSAADLVAGDRIRIADGRVLVVTRIAAS